MGAGLCEGLVPLFVITFQNQILLPVEVQCGQFSSYPHSWIKGETILQFFTATLLYV